MLKNFGIFKSMWGIDLQFASDCIRTWGQITKKKEHFEKFVLLRNNSDMTMTLATTK